MSAPDGGDSEAGGQKTGKKMSFREGAVSFGYYALDKYLAARWAKCSLTWLVSHTHSEIT